MNADEQKIEDKIFSIFSNVSTSIGYSELHGKLIAALLVAQEPISLQDLAKKTDYSLATISLSADLLDVLGVIKKVKKASDRKVYVNLNADLLDCLKKAVLIKMAVAIENSLNDLEIEKKKTKTPKLIKSISILEKEIKRLQKFLNQIKKIDLPK